jgi:hypothetical protein
LDVWLNHSVALRASNAARFQQEGDIVAYVHPWKDALLLEDHAVERAPRSVSQGAQCVADDLKAA